MVNESCKWNNIGAMASRVLLPDGENQNPMRELTALEEILYPMEYMKQKLKIGGSYKTEKGQAIVKILLAAAFFIQIFIKSGICLMKNVFMYCEEPILAKTLQNKGYKVTLLRR